MKIAMICPSNMLFMPYVQNYKSILDENGIQYNIINWDRFQMKENHGSIYRDNKIGHQRKFFDYYLFKEFIVSKLNEDQYEKLIVFGIQLSFFLKRFLQKNYKGKYSIDIRDHHKLIHFFDLKKLIKNSALTVISSPGYKRFLPNHDEYVINHNTQISSLQELANGDVNLTKEKIRISCIGSLKDFEVNRLLIDSLKDSSKFELSFHGDGSITTAIEDHLQREEIKNVLITGRYLKEQEEEFYLRSDLINVFLSNDGINNQTCLANRLYNSVKYKKPMIALEGSYMADQIKKYNLGLVVESVERLEARLLDFITKFNQIEYDQGVNSFIDKVISENTHFRQRLVSFCRSN